MSAVPWQCPGCQAWIAPHVTEHRCEPPDAAQPARLTPVPPAGGGSVTSALLPPGVTITSVSTSTGTSYELTPPGSGTLTSSMQLDGDAIARSFQQSALRYARRNKSA